MKDDNVFISILLVWMFFMLLIWMSYNTGIEKGSQACAIKYGVGRYDAVSSKFVYDNVKEK